MSMIPFNLSETAKKTFHSYTGTSDVNSTGTGTCNWIEITIVNEVIEVLDAKTVALGDDLNALITNEAARLVWCIEYVYVY